MPSGLPGPVGPMPATSLVVGLKQSPGSAHQMANMEGECAMMSCHSKVIEYFTQWF